MYNPESRIGGPMREGRSRRRRIKGFEGRACEGTGPNSSSLICGGLDGEERVNCCAATFLPGGETGRAVYD